MDVVVTLSVTVVDDSGVYVDVVVTLSVTVVVCGCSGDIKCYGGCLWM